MFVIQRTFIIARTTTQKDIHHEEALRDFHSWNEKLIAHGIILKLEFIVNVLLKEFPLEGLRVVISVE